MFPRRIRPETQPVGQYCREFEHLVRREAALVQRPALEGSGESAALRPLAPVVPAPRQQLAYGVRLSCRSADVPADRRQPTQAGGIAYRGRSRGELGNLSPVPDDLTDAASVLDRFPGASGARVTVTAWEFRNRTRRGATSPNLRSGPMRGSTLRGVVGCRTVSGSSCRGSWARGVS
jgi:hypothetical protein